MSKIKKTQSTIEALTENLVEAVSASVPKPEEQEGKRVRWVVVRDGYRVSENEYDDVNDPAAVSEKEFWVKSAGRDGTKIAIVQYNNKTHRIW